MNKSEDQIKIKELMRNLRKKNKKTIEQTAEEMDVSRQTIQNWESGKSKPDSVSLAKFLQTYDPSLEEFQQLLTGNNAKKDKPSHGEILFQHSKEAADNYFNTTGFKIINIESFVESIITPSNYKQYELVDNEDSVLIPLLVYCNYSKEIKNQIDFDFIMATLAIRLKHKGYIVNEITEDGGLRLFIPNEELREHLGSIILEHLLIPESRLKDLPFNEQRCFKGTQEKYDRIRDELSAIKSDEVNPFINENGLSSILGPKEIKKYNLLLGVDQGEDEDGSMEIWCPESDRIYAADSLEELSDFMSSHMEMLKNSVNDDISIVVTENYCTEATFTVTGEANYIEGMRVYYLKDEDDQYDE